jgi:hypothetical protein
MVDYKKMTNTELVDAFENSLRGMIGDDFFDIATELYTRARDSRIMKNELYELTKTLQSIYTLYRRCIIDEPNIQSIKQAIIQRLKKEVNND